MPVIAGKDFTFLTNLNLTDELRIKGILVHPDGGEDIIIVITGDYDQEIDDDVIIITGPATLNLVQADTAVKSISIKSKLGGGDVTITPFAGDTVDAAATVVLAAGSANTFTPIPLDWEITS